MTWETSGQAMVVLDPFMLTIREIEKESFSNRWRKYEWIVEFFSFLSPFYRF